ncbi:hypothetical protein Tcan_10019 [Toxocara canis]|uniref:G-protein coupled receptors family 1 profile domain-containing protein n=1 Tax=Toxocara canis TaxID=6265 RepID=A0A0B2VWB3_TOXCA|nr:hypothetical protein Tcan_10019 [Toxocara canis]
MAYHINNMTLLIRTTKSEKVFSSLLKCPINNDDMAERLDVYPTENNSELGHTLVGIRLSQLTGLFMCGSVHSAIAIAFSRYVALIHPLRYSIFFTKQRTIKFAAFAWTIALIHHVPNIFRK